jgi:hypothetical protein
MRVTASTPPDHGGAVDAPQEILADDTRRTV